jgi:RHS repeat-associated protein
VQVATYNYDPLGRRNQRNLANVLYTYVYDGEDVLFQDFSNVIMEEAMVDPPPHLYVHGPGIDEPLAVEHGNGAVWYYHADGTGSVVAATNSSGTVMQPRAYDSFGNLTDGADQEGYAFTGREWNPESGLYYYRARYYDPNIGRFISEDPVGLLGGVNFYAYVDNDPVNWIDSWGLAKTKSGKKRFKTGDAAAVAGLKLVNPQSIRDNLEICFSVCEQGGTFFNTPALTNYVDSGSCPQQPCPPGSTRFAICHTHGRGNPGFSGGDIPATEVKFVADWVGDITKYDPKLPGSIRDQQKYMCNACAK